MKQFKYELVIEIDEKNVFAKYPNYRWNYDNPKELADSIALGVTIEGDTDMSKDGWEEWGYSIRTTPILPAKKSKVRKK